MLARYIDILDLTSEKPQWYDAVGVPRFCKFHPSSNHNIYAEEALLLEIACQGCGKKFKVSMEWHVMDMLIGRVDKLSERIKQDAIHWGDPPCFDCCSGATMNCYDLRVLEFWQRSADTRYSWVRVPELEVEFKEDIKDYESTFE